MGRVKRRFGGGDILIKHDPTGLDGRPCVVITFVPADILLRFTLEDAESLAEAMIQAVRNAEAHTP